MEIDVNLRKPTTANGLELKTISAGSYSNNNGHNSNLHSHLHNNNNSINNHHQQHERTTSSDSSCTQAASNSPPFGCCGILSRLLCSSHTRGKTATSSGDYNTYNNCGIMSLATQPSGNNGHATAASATLVPPHNSSYMNLLKKNHTHRRTPQEIYFESRGKSCKKLLKFNGNSNKILLYPEEGWARTASSSYWTITPCWWQPNRCRIEEFAGTQRQVTKAKMVPLEQKGSLLIVGHFRSKNSSSSSSASSMSASSTTAAAAAAAAASSSSSSTTTSTTTTLCSPLASSKDNDEFKLYLSSNISMEDYNMGYCLTGFVERRCQQTNTFQMTHFAVIKRQWPSLAQNNKNTKTSSGNSSWTSGSGSGGNAAAKST
ncbi:sericin-2 [Calliphora vicina]|uniref:sericin-2 n=1 Tax=Calliphora vicina TaxID=7373 RepID=UPI00325A7B75